MKSKSIVFSILFVIMILGIITISVYLYKHQETETMDVDALLIDDMLDKLEPGKDYVPNQVLVRYKENRIDLEKNDGINIADNLLQSMSLEETDTIAKDNIQLVQVAGDIGDTMKLLKKNINVETVQLNYMYELTEINTNDTLRKNLWALDNTGQEIDVEIKLSNGEKRVIKVSGTPNADIDAPEAWKINEGTNSNIVVAVIDTGVDYNHPDLKDNMWDGVNCKDFEGKKLGNCMHGYDFYEEDKTPLPAHSEHGTHVAGTIAGIKGNGKGMIGVAPNAKIMALRTTLSTFDNVRSINFAKYNGAKVINASWGGPMAGGSSDDLLKEAIRNFPGLFIVSAGNSGIDNDVKPHKPCSFDLDNIICVAATDQDDKLASFSQYGTKSVDVGAPGVNILSTIPRLELVLKESFDNPPISVGGLPKDWVKGGTNNKWGVKDYIGNKMLSTHFSGKPYDNNADTFVTTPIINLKDTESAVLILGGLCDTQSAIKGNTINWSDYVQIDYTNDGVNYINAVDPLKLHNSPGLRITGDYPLMVTGMGPSIYERFPIGIPREMFTDKFRVKFSWVTNGSDNNYEGCMLDNIQVAKYIKDEQYEYLAGTSMASPHVAGLAALVMGYKPNLTMPQVKKIILESGDSLNSLIGKTVSGKRINAHKAMIMAKDIEGEVPSVPPSLTPSTTVIPTHTTKPVPSATGKVTNTPVNTSKPTNIPTTRPTTSPTIAPTNVSAGSIVCGPADVNGDGRFTLVDFAQFAKTYGRGTNTCSDRGVDYGSCGGKDVDNNGRLELADFGGRVGGYDIGFARRYYPKESCALPSGWSNK